MDLAHAIAVEARALGFHAVGIARAEPLTEEHRRYREHIARGFAGEMSYVADNAQARQSVDCASILPGAKTVICLARRYDRPAEQLAADPRLALLFARYARGRDYHGFLRKRVRKLAAFVRRQGGRARAFCDTAPLLERAWAARAGLGFVGKNGLIIVPGQGSYCLLGEVVTTLELPDSAYGRPLASRCGSCTACLDACPTQAFAAPYVLDARACISYQTIERRSLPEPNSDRGERLFGCDACQEACPYNRVPATAGSDPFAPLPRWVELDLQALVRLDEAAFLRLTEGSPLRRATRRTLAASALILARRRLRADPADADARAALGAGCGHDDPGVARLAAALAQSLDG